MTVVSDEGCVSTVFLQNKSDISKIKGQLVFSDVSIELSAAKVIILTKSRPTSSDCEDNGNTKHFMMNLHLHVAVKNGCYIFFFGDS